MKLSDTAAVLSEAIYKPNPSSMRIEGIRWNFVRTMSKLPTVGVWVNVAMKIVIIAVRGTSSVGDVLQDVHIFYNNVQGTTNYKTAMEVLNHVRNEYKDYQIVVTGHSYAGSVAVKIGKENPDVKAFGFNTGTGYKAIPEILRDKALCNLFRWKAKCYDNVQQYTTRGPLFDPISVISRLDGAKGRTRGKTGIDSHGIANITAGIESETIQPTQRQVEPKPLEDPVNVETQEGGKIMLPRNWNTTRMHDNFNSGIFDRLHRNPIVIK